MPRINGAIREDNLADGRAYVPPSVIHICPVHSSSDGGGVELRPKDVHALLYREVEWEE